MIELHDHPMSPCAQKVRLVLAEKALDYEAHFVDLAAKANLRPEYLALNPKGLVPTLVYDGQPVIESTVIAEFLEERHPQPRLTPDDPLSRARMRVWTKHVDEVIHPAAGALQWPMLMLPVLGQLPQEQAEALLAQVPDPVRRDRQQQLYRNGLAAPVAAAGIRAFDKTLGDMESVLADRPYLLGDTFSLADIGLMPYFQTIRNFAWEALYEPHRPAVGDWCRRCFERPSYAAAIERAIPAEQLDKMRAAGEQAWPELAAHLKAA